MVAPKTEAQYVDMFQSAPLVTVKPTTASGNTNNILVCLDSNSWGEAASRPHLRRVPMSKDAFKNPLAAFIKARHAAEGKQPLAEDEMPARLETGIIYCLIDGGRPALLMLGTLILIIENVKTSFTK